MINLMNYIYLILDIYIYSENQALNLVNGCYSFITYTIKQFITLIHAIRSENDESTFQHVQSNQN